MLLWAIIFVVMIIVEAISVQFVSIWFAVGALIALIPAALNAPLIIQATVFVLSSVVLLFLTFPIIRKHINNKKIATNADANIGKKAKVIETIDNNAGTGRVILNGVNWHAVSSNSTIIEKDSIVVVDEINSTKLLVSIFEN